MHFTVEHPFPAAPERVGTMMVDPEFEASVDLPDLSRAEVIEHSADSPEHLLRVRYQFVGRLDPMVRRLLRGRQLALIQEVRLDPATGRGRLRLEAESDPGRVYGTAEIGIAADGEHASVRRLDGDFVVKLPLMGSAAERKLLPGVIRRLDVEADALTARLISAGDT